MNLDNESLQEAHAPNGCDGVGVAGSASETEEGCGERRGVGFAGNNAGARDERVVTCVGVSGGGRAVDDVYGVAEHGGFLSGFGGGGHDLEPQRKLSW